MVSDRDTRESPPFDANVLTWMTDQMTAKGLIMRNDGRGDPTTQLCPPLIITREECDRAVDVIEGIFDGLGRLLGTVGRVHAAS